MIKRKGALSLILVLGIIICVTPLISQSAQKKDFRHKTSEPKLPKLMPDLLVDNLEFTGQTVKVYIKNLSKVNVKAANMKVKLMMMTPPGWMHEAPVIIPIGGSGGGAIVPTKTINDRAFVIFNATGKVKEALITTKFRILVDSMLVVKESNEQNNIHIYDGTLKRKIQRPPRKIIKKK